MWFGDLVTMTWWEDTWLQESFADYLGYRVGEDAAGLAGNFVDFTVKRKTGGVRRRRAPLHPSGGAAGGGGPRRGRRGEQLRPDLLREGQLRPAPARHLARRRRLPGGRQRLPDPAPVRERDPGRLRRGAERRHRPRRARPGSSSWLRTTGFDTLRVVRDDDGPLLVREGSRPHRVRVTTYDESLAELDSVLVDVADEPVRLPRRRRWWCRTPEARRSPGSASTPPRGTR